MSLAEDMVTAYEIVNGQFPRALAIAREYNLAIQINRKIPGERELLIDHWVGVLEIKGKDREYRVGFQVTLSTREEARGTARIWSLVEDLQDGKYQQFIREDVPLAELRGLIAEGLTYLHERLAAQSGFDPIEARCKRMGTAHYWWYRREDGVDDWTAYMPGGWIGSVVDYDGEIEATLSDGSEDVFEYEGGGTVPEVIAMIEKEYAKRHPE